MYLYPKLLPQQYKRQNHCLHLCLNFVILFITDNIFHTYASSYQFLFFMLIFYFCVLITYKVKYEIAFIISILSHAIFYALNNLCTLFVIFVSSPLYYKNHMISYEYMIILSSILSFISIYFIFKIKRFKSGMNFITKTKYSDTGLVIGFLILTFKNIDNFFFINTSSKNLFILLFLPLATFLLAFLLFSWWRRQVTKSYIDKLRQLEIQSLYDELAEKERLIKKLQEDNSSLSRIIHKDNKLIPAMEHAVTDFLLHNEFTDIAQMEIYGKDLSERLQNMSQDRKGILEAYEEKNHILHLTGNVSIDAILAYMHKRALANHISLECKHTKENVEYLLEKISEEDLSHLLSDLIENALNAMTGLSSGRIVVTFGKLQKEAYLSVADTGDAFSVETLHSFGLKPHTTHESTGGSGIGLMDIWKIKKKYKASIQIQEFDSTIGSLTKKIIFSFNSKNHYVIQSYRCSDIINTQTRSDLYVIPSDNTEINGGKSA